MLLQKAFAKAYGSYQALMYQNPAKALYHLTGGEVETVILKKCRKDVLWSKILQCLNDNWIIGASTYMDSPGIHMVSQNGLASVSDE